MLVQRSLGLQYGNKLMLFVLVETKSATPAFDHSIDGGLTFGDLMVFFILGSTKVFRLRWLRKNLFANAPTWLSTIIPLIDTRSITAPNRIEHWQINSTGQRWCSF
jgi:hypothetical protein